MSSPISLVIMLLLVAITSTNGFAMAPRVASAVINQRLAVRTVRTEIKMNFFEDAVRFFSNMKKEASAKHILIKGPGATEKLNVIKAELVGAEDLSAAFSDLASKVSECPSANRGGNLGTFKPGMMVKEFDEICFEKEVGVVHGPVETQFGAHLILITRRYEGEVIKK